MPLPCQLHIDGFEIGTDRKGQFLKLTLRNDQPFTYTITRFWYETEGVLSGRSEIAIEVGPRSARRFRFDVMAFLDIAFRLEGSRDSTPRRTRKPLGLFTASWTPFESGLAIGNSFWAQPLKSRSAECERLLCRLASIPGSFAERTAECEVWPARVTGRDGWFYFAMIVRDRSTLRAGPFLRQNEGRLQQYQRGPDGHGWYDLESEVIGGPAI
jgi:hypothetical protein